MGTTRISSTMNLAHRVRVPVSKDGIGNVILARGEFTVGATGAVGTVTVSGGIPITVTRSSAGTYKFELPLAVKTDFIAQVVGTADGANNIHICRQKLHATPTTDNEITIETLVIGFDTDHVTFTATDPTENAKIVFACTFWETE